MATSAAKDIASNISNLSRSVSATLSMSTSPTTSFHSSSSSFNQLKRNTTGNLAKQLKPFATEDIKILLLENVNQTGRDILAKQGYQVEALKTSLPEHELIEKIRWGSSYR